MEDQNTNSSRVQQQAGQQTLHPIQLIAVQPIALCIEVLDDPENLKTFDGSLQLESSYMPYDEQLKKIQVKVRAQILQEQKLPITLRVEIIGAFQVDESQFDKQHIAAWASTNAPMVLYPYLRESVFSLTMRVGLPGMIMPLIQIPTFKITPPQAKP